MGSKSNFKKKIFFIVVVVAIVIAGTLLTRNFLKKEHQEDDLINIATLPEKFIQDYLEKVKEIEDDQKDNVLIVTSRDALENTYGATNIVEAPNHQYILQYDSEEDKKNALKELQENSKIISVEENARKTLDMTTSAATYNSWGVQKVGLDYAMSSVNIANAEEIVVAIVDSGLDVSLFNRSYPGKLKEVYNALDPDAAMVDELGHGTHVAGTIAEATPSNVKIISVKVAVSKDFYTTDIIAAINYIAYYDKANVINMSYGGYAYSSAEYQAVAAANSKNIICVAAAGNDNIDSLHYPSSFDNTISVSSVDSKFQKSDFSNYGSTVTFSAPGTSIVSINGTKSGTSMATPHVTSAVAILKTFNKNITLEDSIALLKKHAIDLGDEGWDQVYGYGLINFKGATFCDNVACDDFGIFKKSTYTTLPILKIQSAGTVSPQINYGNETNIMNATFRLYYTADNYYTKTLAQLGSQVEIVGYDPVHLVSQNVTVRYRDLQVTLTVNNSGADTDGWEYSVLSDRTIRLTNIITSSSNYPEVIIVPEEFDGYQVSSLGPRLFAEEERLKRIKLSSGITTIESEAFYNCTELYEVQLPNTLVEIGESAFDNVIKLSKIDLPTSLRTIGDGAFKFSGLTSIVIPNGVKKINRGAFTAAESLQSVTLPNGLEIIDGEAFSGTIELKSIVLPNTLKSIEIFAFEDTGLTSVVIPASVETIGNSAFRDCSQLTSVTFAEGLKSLGKNAFVGTKLVSVRLPRSLEQIGINPFFNVDTLESIVIDSGNAFYESRNANIIVEKATLKLIAAVNSTIPDDIKIVASHATNGDVETITVPESVVELQDLAFGGCGYTTLKKIILPKSLTTIDKDAFKVVRGKREELPNGLGLWLYESTPSETYAKSNNIVHTFRQPKIEVQLQKDTYAAFETVQKEHISLITATYGGTTTTQTHPGAYTITYAEKRDSLRYGDTNFIISFVTEIGDRITYEVGVTVVKATPTFDIPTDLKAKKDQKLSDIPLPSGFVWMNADEVITATGNLIYKAKYVPADTTNFELIENIEIPLFVEILNPIFDGIKGYEGVYDGNEHSIVVTPELSNYSIYYSLDGENYTQTTPPKFKDVGQYTVYYKITSDDYGDTFGNNEIKIYGIERLDKTLEVKQTILIVKDYSSSFKDISKKITVFAPKHSMQHQDKKNTLITNDLTKTGEKIHININDQKNYEYIISILGDVNGDGKINYLDYVTVYNHIYKSKHPESSKKLLENEYLIAADTSLDGKISYLDYVKIYNKIKELKGGAS